MMARCFPLVLPLILLALSSACVTFDHPLVPGSIPERQAIALEGLAFGKVLAPADEVERERLILRELRRGNVPDFLRQPAHIRYQAKTRSGRVVTVTVWVLKDYLAVGSDDDFVRVPMNPVTAQRVADSFGYSLPTARIVDEIYRAAEIKLAPIPFRPTAAMVSVGEFLRHDQAIRAQLDGDTPSALVAGHKKDVVLSNQLDERPQKVAIYGWHMAGGRPIQPLSTVHGNWYADYSHGIRLVSSMMLVNDQPLPLAEVLQDAELAPIVSYEGTLTSIRYRTENVIQRKTWRPRS